MSGSEECEHPKGRSPRPLAFVEAETKIKVNIRGLLNNEEIKIV